jgi:hypothetical protein
MNSIKLCECGCGQPTKLSTKTDKSNGRIKGQPMHFIKGHAAKLQKIKPTILYESPVLCQCGCGGEVLKSKQSEYTKGYKKGEARKFISGHNLKTYIKPISKRIKENIIINNNTNCWEWNGYKDKNGYGIIGYKNKKWFVHRLIYLLIGGILTSEKPHVLHHCDNPSCCNPLHLFSGNDADNNRDMIQKGRKVILRGERAGNAKLTVEQVINIKTLREEKKIPYKLIANKYNISEHHVWLICKKMTWKHLWK